MDRATLFALVGPTAAGKSEAGVALAGRIVAEIVSVDSMLIYRRMDVGTAKPTAEQRRRVPHHLLDLVDPSEPFSVSRFQRLAGEAIAGVRSRGAVPLLVGSGGLYLRAVVDGLTFPGTDTNVRGLLETEARVLGAEAMHRRLAEIDPDGADGIQPANVRRSIRALEVAALTGRSFSSFAGAWRRYRPDAVRAAGIEVPRPVLRRRIEARVQSMMPGLLFEAASLASLGFSGFLTASQAIGYAEAVACLEGRLSQDEAVARTIQRTNALARRQLAWLRRDPRVVWFVAGTEGAAGVLDQLDGFFGPARYPVLAAAEG
jgi:tRNA dimethylallyltransferase